MDRITENPALFSPFGTTCGGDRSNTSALPDLRGRVPFGRGSGPRLGSYRVGAHGGREEIILPSGQMPAHTLTAISQLCGVSTPATSPNPAKNLPALSTTAPICGSGETVAMSGQATQSSMGTTGASLPVSVRDPFLTLRWCVVTSGKFPQRD